METPNTNGLETQMDSSQDYLLERLQYLGITPEQNNFLRIWEQTSSEEIDNQVIAKPQQQQRVYPIFSADNHGNIVIQYFNPYGQPYRWKKEGDKMPMDYVRKRLRDPKGDQKYFQESGSAPHPFFTPGIIKKFKANKESIKNGKLPVEPIETLYLVEGEFKAFKGWMCGLDIIGLGGIHGFYSSDTKGKIHEDIQDVIITCHVKKIVILFDADLLSLKWEENKDLHTRPASFYGSIKAFRESLQLLIDDPKVGLELCYFMHIQTKYMNEAKGLDDLFCTYTAVTADIVSDLKELNYAKKYFYGQSILDQHRDVHGRVSRYLGLTNEQEFYKTYKDFIGSREFMFKRKRYEYNEEKKEVVFVRHEDADKYMRIGSDWFKVIQKPDKYGINYEELKVWPISEITRDYKVGRSADHFIEQLMRYDDFINEPAWNSSYRRVINNCYNLCYPLRWEMKAGPLEAIYLFLKHIFGGKATLDNDIEGDPFTIALDWFTIFHQNPKQPLPVIVLVSKENETGKTTLMKFLRLVYGANNAVILSNEEFKMRFNQHYISKSLIMVDEGFLDAEKKSEKERLKKLVTSDTVYIEFKGADLKLINYYAKIIISSNDDDRVMKIDEEENRWFVVKVPVPKEKDPDLENKMLAEVPAWLHFLSNRQVFHPRKSRLWFQSDLIITEQFKKIVDATKNRIDRVFEDWIRHEFMLYRLPELKYSLNQLTTIFNNNNNSKYKVDKIDLRNYLQRKGIESEKRSQRFKTPIKIIQNNPNEVGTIEYSECDPTFPYVFKIQQWLTRDEEQNLLPFSDPEKWIIYPVGKPFGTDSDKLPF